MIADKELTEAIARRVNHSASDNLFKSFDHFTDHVKLLMRTEQWSAAKQCFDWVANVYGRCTNAAQLAIDNVFLFSIGSYIERLNRPAETKGLLSEPLAKECGKLGCTRGI